MIDVARHAGVSIKTVSRVLNDVSTVQDIYKIKVLNSIKELNYIPSPTARALRSGRSYKINFVSNSSRNTYANRVLFGALRSCHDIGYQMVLNVIDEGQLTERGFAIQWVRDITRRDKPEGVILVPPLATDRKLVTALIKANIPTVSIGALSIHKKQSSVVINEKLAAKDITKFLIKRGHQKIAFVFGSKGQTATDERFSGYKEALYEANLSVNESLLYQGNFDFSSGLEAGKELLSRSPRPSAVFASNDEMASGIIVAAQKLGIEVPNELSIVGFDDNTFAEELWPGLTTIKQPLEKFGQKAIEILNGIKGDLANMPSDMDEVLDYEMIERESVLYYKS